MRRPFKLTHYPLTRKLDKRSLCAQGLCQMALSDKQRRFVAEYLRDHNATAAAIRAGYSPRTSYSIGQENLTKPEIKASIESRACKIEGIADVELGTVLIELKRILLADPSDALNPNGGILPMREWPLDLRRALSGMDVEEIWEKGEGRGAPKEQVGEVKKFKLWSKTHAAEQLLRTLGAFHDRLEVDVTSYTDLVRALDKTVEVSSMDAPQDAPAPQGEAIGAKDE